MIWMCTIDTISININININIIITIIIHKIIIIAMVIDPSF